LEDRRLLATVNWDGGGLDGLWHTPANWSGDQVPGSADDVVLNVAAAEVIRFAGSDVTVASLLNHETLRIESGVLNVTKRAQVHGQVSLQGGQLGTSDLILVGGSLTVTGAMSYAGRLVMDPGSSLTADGSGASFEATGATSLLGASFYALNGGRITIANVENYAFASTTSNWEYRTFRATGVGSKIELPGLKEIVGGTLRR